MDANVNDKRQLQENVKSNLARMNELHKEWQLAQLGLDIQRQQEKEMLNKALAEHEFFASTDEYMRYGYHKGDRVTNEEDMFLLSKEDLSKVFEIARPAFVMAGITDDEGFYTTDWLGMVCDAKKALVNFIIDNVIPQSMRADLEHARGNVIYQEKLIDLFFKNDNKS